jgi:hypothetical protein
MPCAVSGGTAFDPSARLWPSWIRRISASFRLQNPQALAKKLAQGVGDYLHFTSPPKGMDDLPGRVSRSDHPGRIARRSNDAPSHLLECLDVQLNWRGLDDVGMNRCRLLEDLHALLL